MKVKTSELIDAALDWAVAKCEGVNAEAFRLYYEPTEPTDYDSHGYPEFHYSSIWSQGGPIIDRAKISVIHMEGTEHWMARKFQPDCDTPPKSEGPTSLIAAMRCYVTSKLGDTVDIPKELLKSASQAKKETP